MANPAGVFRHHDGNGTQWMAAAGSGSVSDPYVQSVDMPGVTETSADGNTALKVFIQDQTTPALFVKASKLIAGTTIAVQPTIEDKTVTLTDSSGMSVGELLFLTSVPSSRFYTGRILGNTANVITLDTPIDFAFEVGQEAKSTTTNMAVDGSSTTQIFSARSAEPTGGLGLVVDVTRMIFKCITATAVDLSKFGDQAALIKGVVVRRTDGVTINQFNIKTNGDIAELMFDYMPYDAQNAQQGQHGFVARLTYGGGSKVGVVVRLGPGDDLEFMIQDNLSAITSFEVTLEGHVVQNG